MNKDLLANVEGKTPTFLKDNGNKKQGRGVLGLMLLAFFAVFFGGKTWGQITDYSGTYYIGVFGKNDTSEYDTSDPNNSDNFYLCPTESWLYYVATNSCIHDDDPGNGQPFLTSYKCKGHSGDANNPYDLTKAVWVITKLPNSNYYYIQQRKTGKYLVFNGQISSSGVNRIRVHLETIEAPNNPGDNALFAISMIANSTNYNGYWAFHPKNAGSGYYLNITDGNYDQLIGDSHKDDGPTVQGYTPQSKYVGGTIGQWSQANNTSSFYLEDYITRPTISYSSGNNVEITYPVSALVYYTTDGSDPTDSDNTNRSYFTGTSETVSFTNVAVVKAAAYIGGEYSNIASYVYVYTDSDNPYLLQSVANTDFYMVAGDLNSSNNPTVNTSSLPQAGMSWQFEDAGLVNGVQCYYVKNTSANGYLRRDNNSFYIQSTYADHNDYKFEVIPYLNESGTLAGFYLYNIGKAQYVYKASTNNVVGNGSDAAVNLTPTANQDLARWNLILVENKSFPSPVTLSDNSSVTYYTFASSNTSTQLITPPTGTSIYVKTSSGENGFQKWYFTDAGSDGWASYYYILNAMTGEAMYFGGEPTPNTIQNALEMRPLPEAPTDSYKFALAHTVTDGEYYIVPKPLTQFTKTKYTAVWYVNTTSSLQTQSNRASSQIKWQISEKVNYVAPPYITYDVATNTATISSTYPGATIYYTIDGSEATTNSTNSVAPVAPSYTASTSFELTAGVTTIRAIAYKEGAGTSSESTYSVAFQLTLSDDPADQRPYLIQSQNNAWNTTDYHFYMIPGDEDANNITKVNTTSLFRPSMEWHFLNAGIEDDVQYYYIVNNANSKYLCYDATNGVYMDTYANDTIFKFRIVESPTAGTYNIIPYRMTSGNRFLNKKGNNAGADNVILYNSSSDANARWKFVLPSNLDKNAPFTVSNPSTQSYSYFKIASVGSSGHYIIPGATNVTTSNSSDPTIVNTMNWYFEVAQAASDADWLTYFYIRNAVTGDYLYFTKNGNNDGACLKMCSSLDTITSGNEDRCLFTWAKTAAATANYYIIPKRLKDVSQNNFSALRKHDSNTSIITNLTRGAGNYAWTFNESSFQCATPEITINAAQGTATLTCATPGASIYYVLYNNDSGADPDLHTPSSPALNLYDGTPVDMGMYSYIKAIAARDSNGGDQSDVAGAAFHCLTPIITFDNTTNQVTISSTPGSTIYYTTNGDPVTIEETTSHGTTPVTFSVNATTTIRAIAVKGEGSESEEADVTINKVDTPVIFFDGIRVTITCSPQNAIIHYEIGDSPSVPAPTLSSPIYVMPLTNVAGKYLKAAAFLDNWITSEIASIGPITPQCAPPVIRRGVNNTFTIECSFPAEGSTIYYTTDNSITEEQLAANPTIGTIYSTPVHISIYPVTVKAIAIANGYANSVVVTHTITQTLEPTGDWYEIASAGDFDLFVSLANTDGAGYNYRVTDNFTVNNPAAITQPFSGTFDGNYFTITGLTHSLFDTLDGGTVKNVVFDNVSISGTGNVGAICNVADGTTKIYNCGVLSGSVTGTDKVGGLVGLVRSGSSVRVVNCYNYADVSGGDYAAGIVGKNEGTVSSDGTVGNVRIALCMMYGNVTDAINISPVYGGNHVNNVSNYSEYNYWRYRSGLVYTVFNDQLAVEYDDYLTRFPYYRHILNSHRKMAAYFLFGGVSCNNMDDITDDNIAEMGHWVLKKDVADFPIIEPWPYNTTSTPTYAYNNLPSSTEDYAGKLLANMGSNGYLAVSVIIGSNTYSVSLPITDMDTLNYDFTWGKVVLPFANEFEVNTDYSKVCTGWKITGITGGNAGSFENYNVSDRNCTTKDLYSTTGFIFAQGGYYIVPYNVTAIEITANFATAFYLCDESYEIAYEKDGTIVPPQTSAPPSGYMNRTTLAGSTPNSFTVGQNVYTIYHTLAAALDAMSASGTPHAQAIVLLGNYHLDDFDLTILERTSKGYTFMSIDADNNQEPDYAIYSNNTMNRPAIPPTRYDFVAFIPLGMSSHVNGALFYPNTPIWKPRGWFEITETGLMWAKQFEIESNNFNTSDSDVRNYRCIINGGYFTQMVRSKDKACTKLKYYQIGGKAYVKEFYPGNHSAENKVNTLVPVNVTGGEIEQCFMTGYGKGTVYGPDIYFWCAGGRIHKFLGAYMEKPRQTANSDGTVNLTAKIDHARIYRFFGGGTTSKARITGNIKVTIDNSFIDFYCGGPEFGDMEANKTVTTTATNTTFREYYGAGFGGTATTYTNDEDLNMNIGAYVSNNVVSYPSNFFNIHYLDPATDVGRLDYKTDYGIGNCYKFEFIMHSRGHQVVARFYTGYAMFSLAKTGSVTNTLTNCIVERNFYGGGCQGTVDGTVTSTLTGCTIFQSAFGGGYKAESNEVVVYPTTPVSPLSTYNCVSSVFSDFGDFPTPDTCKWIQGTPEHNNEADETNHILYTGTNVTMTDLGNVTGDITITLDGNTVVHGNVFGGGHESKALSSATVTITGTSEVKQNVFGGGNMASVGINTTDTPGNTTVKLQQSAKVLGNVYGGGNEGPVGGDSKVIIEDEP